MHVVLNHPAIQAHTNPVLQSVTRVIALEAAARVVCAQQALVSARCANSVLFVLLIHTRALVWRHELIHGEGGSACRAFTREIIQIRVACCAVVRAAHESIRA